MRAGTRTHSNGYGAQTQGRCGLDTQRSGRQGHSGPFATTWRARWIHNEMDQVSRWSRHCLRVFVTRAVGGGLEGPNPFGVPLEVPFPLPLLPDPSGRDTEEPLCPSGGGLSLCDPGAGPRRGSGTGPSLRPSLCFDPDFSFNLYFSSGSGVGFPRPAARQIFAMFCLRQPQMPRNVMCFFQLCGKEI